MRVCVRAYANMCVRSLVLFIVGRERGTKMMSLLTCFSAQCRYICPPGVSFIPSSLTFTYFYAVNTAMPSIEMNYRIKPVYSVLLFSMLFGNKG